MFFKREKVEYNKRTSNPWKPDKNFEKEILVFCDQGFGDHIQFIRYLPLLKEKVEKGAIQSY